MKTMLFTLALTLATATASAEVAVVANPANAAELDNNTIARIFLGKIKSFPDGTTVVPLAQQESAAVTAEFNDKVLGKSSGQLKAYWSKLIFTGKGTPPESLSGNDAVISQVAANANAIGYVDASAVDDSVKVIATF